MMNLLWFVVNLGILMFVTDKQAFSEGEEAIERAFDEAAVSPSFLVWSSVTGVLVTVFVAYRSARRAGLLFLRHGGWTAVVATVFSAGFLLIPSSGDDPAFPFWYMAFSIASVVPSGMLGGWFAARADERAA
ncbi:MAG: hypothetical protein HKP30_06850 [Myxococcales bacterium]|nr:hypothetical protein [Myxococcales bacterium]